MIAKQNKWHASRYGLDASFVDFDTMQAVPAKTIIRNMLDRCEPYADKLGCLTQLRYIDDILENGTGAQRQRRVYEQTGDLREVVKFLVEQGELNRGQESGGRSQPQAAPSLTPAS
jgi:carboxylate-amine ligase